MLVVALNYDFWSTIAEADGTPALNADGLLFYVRHRPGWSAGDAYFWPDSPGFQTLAEAVAAAESTIPAPVTWQFTSSP
ncbi:hypothetical protein ACQPZJ_08975 [Actinoplanes sp. CA-054009]